MGKTTFLNIQTYTYLKSWSQILMQMNLLVVRFVKSLSEFILYTYTHKFYYILFRMGQLLSNNMMSHYTEQYTGQ